MQERGQSTMGAKHRRESAVRNVPSALRNPIPSAEPSAGVFVLRRKWLEAELPSCARGESRCP